MAVRTAQELGGEGRVVEEEPGALERRDHGRGVGDVRDEGPRGATGRQDLEREVARRGPADLFLW